MSYAEQGTGEPLVLVHGTLCDRRYWASQMRPLGRRYRVVAPSLRHYWPERWDGTGGDFTIAQHVADLAAFIVALGAGPAHLVGHSRGGHVAFRVAQHAPERVRALVLAEPGGVLDATLAGTPPAGPEAALARLLADAAAHVRRGAIDAGLALFVDAVSGSGTWARAGGRFGRMARDNAVTLLGQAGEQRAPFSRADAEAIRAPTLLVGGARTPPPFPSILDAMERHLPDVRRVTIPRASHPMNQENPDDFNAAVLDFLARH